MIVPLITIWTSFIWLSGRIQTCGRQEIAKITSHGSPKRRFPASSARIVSESFSFSQILHILRHIHLHVKQIPIDVRLTPWSHKRNNILGQPCRRERTTWLLASIPCWTEEQRDPGNWNWKMLFQTTFKPAQTEWPAPIIFAPKKNGTFRFWVDYRKFNAVTRHNLSATTNEGMHWLPRGSRNRFHRSR